MKCDNPKCSKRAVSTVIESIGKGLNTHRVCGACKRKWFPELYRKG